MTYMHPNIEEYKNILEECGILTPTSLSIAKRNN